jgi:hypothetical protein
VISRAQISSDVINITTTYTKDMFNKRRITPWIKADSLSSNHFTYRTPHKKRKKRWLHRIASDSVFRYRSLVDLLGALWLVQTRKIPVLWLAGVMSLHIDGMRRATAHFGHYPYESFHGLTLTVLYPGWDRLAKASGPLEVK